MIICHAPCTVSAKESPRYHPGIVVEFNETAFMNDNLTLIYIEIYLIPTFIGPLSLFVLDLCASDKTLAVRYLLRKNHIKLSMIPAHCIDCLEPLDISVNNFLKAQIRDLADQAIVDSKNIDDFKRYTVGDRRVLTIWCVRDR